MRASLIAIAGAATLAVGCTKPVTAPFTPGVCYSVALPESGEGPPRFNVLATEQPAIEFCAARLEEMRLRFLRLGGNNRDVVGAYQGKFIFIDGRGVSFNNRLDGVKFIALARTGDGRLAIPGAIQRQIDGAPAPVAAPPPLPAE